ncbi:MAG: hypothetical protein M2R45_04612 [Verrucomicrobia subdivision 3 bacterium]|nr:hypothetical protein [Limisphaerales bacterium]MCS1417325.1 hypothetical protein [Limisphaerales bacterium]
MKTLLFNMSESKKRAKQVEDDFKKKMVELYRQLTEGLSNILLGEKIPLDVINSETGDIIIPANRKITKTLLRRLAGAYDRIEIDPSPTRNKIDEIIGSFKRKFDDLQMQHNEEHEHAEACGSPSLNALNALMQHNEDEAMERRAHQIVKRLAQQLDMREQELHLREIQLKIKARRLRFTLDKLFGLPRATDLKEVMRYLKEMKLEIKVREIEIRSRELDLLERELDIRDRELKLQAHELEVKQASKALQHEERERKEHQEREWH